MANTSGHKKDDQNTSNLHINRSNFQLVKPKLTFRSMDNQIRKGTDLKKFSALNQEPSEIVTKQLLSTKPNTTELRKNLVLKQHLNGQSGQQKPIPKDINNNNEEMICIMQDDNKDKDSSKSLKNSKTGKILKPRASKNKFDLINSDMNYN